MVVEEVSAGWVGFVGPLDTLESENEADSRPLHSPLHHRALEKWVSSRLPAICAPQSDGFPANRKYYLLLETLRQSR